MQEKPPPKKRGRKSKKTLEAEAKLKNNATSEPVKVPKKRGRKPKGGIVVEEKKEKRQYRWDYKE